jgi:hypothetical protein
MVAVDSSGPELVVNAEAVLESSAKTRKHLHTFITLADNLANYARTQLRENPVKAMERLRELEK